MSSETVTSISSEAAHTVSSEEQYLTFHLGVQAYGVAVLRVKEIQQYSELTAIPRTPAYLSGVINLRGNVVPVIDLGCLLDGQPSGITKRSCIVIVEADIAGAGEERLEAGIIVDAVDQVVNLAPDDIEATPAVGIGQRARFISGMGHYGDGFVILLNLNMILGPEEIQIITRESSPVEPASSDRTA